MSRRSPSKAHRRGALLAVLAAAATPAVVPAWADAAPRKVPFGFHGVTMDVTSIKLGAAAERRERSLMVRSGVESVRLLVSWPDMQPYRSFAEVPRARRSRFVNVRGVPTDFSHVDSHIAPLAERGIRVLPVVAFAPQWASRNAFQPGADPSDREAYGRFLRALIERYGPRGTLWRTRRVPFSGRVRYWQIWNEPDLPFMWTNQARNFASEYVALLRVARRAVKSADPGAKVVLGGLTSSITWPKVWTALNAVYRAGGRGLFDIVAIHPFTRTPDGVLQILRRVRTVMRRRGDGARPLMVTEFSWSSRRGRRRARRLATWEVTPAQQAHNVARAYRLFATNRRSLRLVGAYWFAWMTNDRMQFWSYWAGLRRRVGTRGVSKPALRAYAGSALRFQGCRKARLAHRCAPKPRRSPRG